MLQMMHVKNSKLSEPVKASKRRSINHKIIDFIIHLHPRKVPVEVLSFNKTWGLGGMALVLVGLLMFSGTLMILVYKPVPEQAYQSVSSLAGDYTFGRLIRNVHFFSANFLVVIALSHMLRVLFTLGFIKARAGNWLIGIGLLVLTLFSCFTGYLLPWDQTAYWAVTICIHMLEYLPLGEFLTDLLTDGDGVSAKTLQIFFTCHTTLIPILLITMLSIHFWKIRKAGGVIFSHTRSLEERRRQQSVHAWPNLFLREAVVGLWVIAVVMVLSLLFDAPLDEMANSGLSPNPAKAPWYFCGFQELLFHFDPILGVGIIPALALGMLSALPFFSTPDENAGNWFISPKGAKVAMVASLSACLLIPAYVLATAFVFDLQNSGGSGKLPLGDWTLFLIIVGGAVISYALLKKKWGLTVNEVNQTLITFFITAYIMLTLICVWFRGPGMELGMGAFL